MYTLIHLYDILIIISIYSRLLINSADQYVFSELKSPFIQKDVAILLQSPRDKFAPAIGIGSACQIPK
jgi:hypothetical protein